MVVVVSKFNRRQMLVLAFFELQNVDPQHMFQYLDGSLDCPSAYGWNMVLKHNLVSNASVKTWKWTTHLDPNLWTMGFHIGLILSMYNLDSLSNGKLCLIKMKCAVLVNLSTIIQIPSQPFGVLGNLNKKSMLMCSHFHSRFGKGHNNPLVFCRWGLTCWQVKYLATNFAIFRYMPGHE